MSDAPTATEEKEAERAALADLQNTVVPEQRPQATLVPPESNEGDLYRKMKEAGDPRVDTEPMGQEAYDRAASSEQAKKAAKASRVEAMIPGSRAVVVDPGAVDDGRMVAVNRVSEWASPEDERLHAAGTSESRFAEVAEYECRTRDGRHEILFLSPDKLKQITDISNYNKNPT